MICVCAACEDRSVNAHERLIVQASHSGWNDEVMTYQWSVLELRGDGDNEDNQPAERNDNGK